MRAVLIGNPSAGQKAGFSTNSGTVDDAVAALREIAIDPVVWLTSEAGDGTVLARRALDQGFELVIAAGGDGTVQEVAQPLVGTAATLGVMPLGSIMNVARTLGITRDLAQAAEVIASGRLLAMDVGQVRDRYFLEYASVGIDAHLRPLWHQIDAGRWSLIRAFVRALLRYRSRRMTIRVDGQEHRVHALMTVVANTPYFGWAVEMHPEAKIDDGCFEVKIFNRFTVAELLIFGIKLRCGLRPRPDKIRHLRGKAVEITARRPLAVHADVKPSGTTPVSFQIVPQALRVWANPELWDKAESAVRGEAAGYAG
jgi:diacylglycerol kinase (ATP)